MTDNNLRWFSWMGLIILLVATNGCQIDPCGSAPSDLIENLEDLVKEVKEKDYNPKDDRWKSYDDRFRTYFEDCYDQWSPDMTTHQKGQFAGLVTRYIGNRFGKSLFKSIFGGEKSGTDDFPESVEQMGEDVIKFLKENKETGKEVLEELMNEVSDWFDNESESK